MRKEDFRNTGINELFAFTNIFNIISDTQNFHTWLKKIHKIEKFDSLFVGYRFFLEVIIHRIIYSISLDDSLNLTEDEVYWRARSSGGINLADFPNSCEKTIISKNIWKSGKKIREAKDWNELIDTIKEINNQFLTFNFIFNNYTISKSKISKKIVLLNNSMNYTHIFLNDTQRIRPNAYPEISLDSSINEENAVDIFLGYSYSLQYLWYSFLGDKKFKSTSIKNIHKAEELFGHERFHSIDDDLYGDAYHDAVVKWDSLDRFFGIINKEIFESNIDIRKNTDLLVLNKDYDKQILKTLLRTEDLPEPEYLTKTDTPELKSKKMDLTLLWFPFDYLNSEKRHDFNGSFSFIYLLEGYLKRKGKNSKNEIVLRIKHPQSGINGFFYSYGILLDNFYDFGDIGWIITLACSTDFSGHGGDEHKRIERTINEYQKIGILDVREITIDEEFFEDYLKTHRLYKHLYNDFSEENGNDMEMINNSLESEKKYDVALSYASEDQKIVDQIAKILRDQRNINVFYDDFEKTSTWGKNLAVHLPEIYFKQSLCVIIFLSKYYPRKKFTKLEKEAALAKSLESDQEYILPVIIDDSDKNEIWPEGIIPTIAYLDLNKIEIEQLCDQIQEKIIDLKNKKRNQKETTFYGGF